MLTGMISAMFLALSQDNPAANPKVDQARVDAAISKGCKWILAAKKEDLLGTWAGPKRYQAPTAMSRMELVLLTLLHSGMYDIKNPDLTAMLETMLTREFGSTYTVALQAMVLQKIDPEKYLPRLAECAHYLVANQAQNGQWDYGENPKCNVFKPPEKPKSADDPVIVATGGAAGVSGKPPKPALVGGTQIVQKFKVPCAHRGPIAGDDSNSQYAALGLRACMDAGIEVHREILVKARGWWNTAQCRDTGWGYEKAGPTGTGSMTVGAIGAMCIFDYYLGQDYTKDPTIKAGQQWVATNFSVEKNPQVGRDNQYYYLYGLERAGILSATETFGKHEWYPEGATYLLTLQNAVGSWGKDDIVETCFAILFLKRAIKPLVIIKSEDKKPKK